MNRFTQRVFNIHRLWIVLHSAFLISTEVTHVLTALFACYKAETAAARRTFGVHHTTMQQLTVVVFWSHSHSGVHARLAVTCHLLFWRNVRNLSRATERERERAQRWNEKRNWVSTECWHWRKKQKEEKKSSAPAAGTRTRYLSIKSPHSTAEVFPPSTRSLCTANIMDGKRWQLLQQAGIYFGLWWLPVRFDGCWSVLMAAGQVWWLLVSFDGCWSGLMAAGPVWWLLPSRVRCYGQPAKQHNAAAATGLAGWANWPCSTPNLATTLDTH